MEELPFYDVDGSFEAAIDLEQDEEKMMKQLEYATSNRDVKLAHLNVCSLRNKIEELR